MPDSSEARAVLGLPLDATRDEAQRAFRRLAKQTHPDAGGNAASFRAVASAWAELGATLPPAPRRIDSPHVRAYRATTMRVVWAETRPSTVASGSSAAPCRHRRHDAAEKTGGPTFAKLLQAEMDRLAA